MKIKNKYMENAKLNLSKEDIKKIDKGLLNIRKKMKGINNQFDQLINLLETKKENKKTV